jgi:trehalose synthase-fused probable maltokinase
VTQLVAGSTILSLGGLSVDNHAAMPLEGEHRAALTLILPDYIRGRRWFGGKARQLRSVQLIETAPVNEGAQDTIIAIIQVDYADGGTQKYVLPLGFTGGDDAERVAGAAITTLHSAGEQGEAVPLTVYDATFDPGFTLGLLDAIKENRITGHGNRRIEAWRTPGVDQLDTWSGDLSPSVIGAEQSNTSIKYGERYILKLFRRLEEGVSPELEFGRYLSEKGFPNTPPLLGAIEYKGAEPEPLTLAILQSFERNQGDAWSYTLRSLEGYIERSMSRPESSLILPPTESRLLELAGRKAPSEFVDLAGDYLSSARLLARRTAEMHLALGDGRGDPAFEPEPFTPEYQAWLFDAMNATANQAFGLLRGKLDSLPPGTRVEAEDLLAKEDRVAAHFEPLRARPISAIRTRVHGDYHLGQVLYTGSDFMIIDFEGEPVRSLAERRRKHSQLKDVAGMLRSFHYAAYSAFFDYLEKHDNNGGRDDDRVETWVQTWQVWVSAAYLHTYLATAGDAAIMPANREDLEILLNAHLLEKAVYELIYELNNRPGWVRIPLSGIAQLAG